MKLAFDKYSTEGFVTETGKRLTGGAAIMKARAAFKQDPSAFMNDLPKKAALCTLPFVLIPLTVIGVKKLKDKKEKQM